MRSTEINALVERFRRELAEAEQEFREAITPECQRSALDRFEKAVAQYVGLTLNKKPHPSGSVLDLTS